MSTNKVLYVAQEIVPYLDDSPEAINCRYLPQLIQEKGKEIRTFMPNYGIINERRHQLHEVIRLSGMNLIINDADHPLIIKVASIQAARMQVYFIDNDDYFKRKGTVVNSKGEEYSDNDERCIFYARGVLETIKKLRWVPDVIDCHGWMSSLVGLYVKKTFAEDPCFRDAKVVTSLYNTGFEQTFDASFASKAIFDGITEKDMTGLQGEVNYEKLMKFAIDYSDAVILSQDGVAKELVDYAKQSGKKFLDYQGEYENSVEGINDFYDNL